MRVLRIISSMDPANGGPCQGIRNSIPALEKLGVHNEVVCLDAPAAPFLREDPFAITALGAGRGSWCYSPNLLPWLLQHLPRFDAVIVHGLWQYHGYATQKALRLLQKAQLPYVGESTNLPALFVMPHGMLDPYFQRAPGRKLKSLRNLLYWWLLEQKLINRAEGVLFTCSSELELAREPFRPYHPKRELNIGYGILSPPAYTSGMQAAFLEKCPILRNEPFLLFLSRVHEKKGVELLLRAYLRMLRRHRQAGLAVSVGGKLVSKLQAATAPQGKLPKLVIAGPGQDTPYGKSLQHLAREYKEDVVFTGMLSGDAKWGAFHAAEAFVLPSHQENFGIAVVEALACRKPVIISDQVNIWREIEAGGGGLVAADTLAGITELLEYWVSLSVKDKIDMGQQARHVYEEHFAIGPAAARMHQCLSSVLHLHDKNVYS